MKSKKIKLNIGDYLHDLVIGEFFLRRCKTFTVKEKRLNFKEEKRLN